MSESLRRKKKNLEHIHLTIIAAVNTSVAVALENILWEIVNYKDYNTPFGNCI